MKKTLAALALAGSIALIGSPAVAAEYPALPPQAAVSDGVVGPGESFVFRGLRRKCRVFGCYGR